MIKPWAGAGAAGPGQAVVITADGKGIAMRPEYRRKTGGRKKMAELACVYTCDPDQRHRRVVLLVDGNRHQIQVIETEAADRGMAVHIVLDVIHVLEYIWEAAEAWVADRMSQILHGRARAVATGIRRCATRNGYTGAERKTLDRVAGYLDNNAIYMDYPHALANGWPIATGVIEGACRHLVKDRFDITGARWPPTGTEAVLKLRALTINGDFDTHWDYHQQRELERNHLAHYQPQDLTTAA